MLKRYKWRDGVYQFEETAAPIDAVLIEDAKPAEVKEKKPANKAKQTKTK